MKRILLFVLLPLWCVSTVHGQKDSLLRKLDSLEKKGDTVKPVDRTEPRFYNDVTKITFPVYFQLLGSNLKQQFTGPFHTSKKTWGNVGKLAIATGLLAFADHPLQKEAVTWRHKSGAVRDVGRVVTDFGGIYEGYTLAALGTFGWIFKKEKMKNTTLLATQAYVTGSAVAMVVKWITGRQRPNYFGNDSIAAHATFHGPFSVFTKDKYNGNTFGSSFPSGHSTVAFAAATVFAMEYRDKPLVPIIAYTSATLIGFSRITENKHWATDVLVGAALGWLSGRQVVRNYHRYARIKSAEAKKKGNISFSLDYRFGQVLPAVVWKL